MGTGGEVEIYNSLKKNSLKNSSKHKTPERFSLIFGTNCGMESNKKAGGNVKKKRG